MHIPESLVKGIWILQPFWQCHASTFYVPGPFLIYRPSSNPIWDFFFLQDEISVNCPRKQEALVQLPAVSTQVGASTFPATQTKGQLTWVSGGMCCSQVSVGPA